ncbi:MAG: hypothetical protein AAFZ65_19485, partial [Planctomycetota bacterium]
RPEFLNRLDEVVTYAPLEPEQLRGIVEVQLARVRQHLAEQEIELDVSLAAMDRLAEEGFDAEFGARPLKRVLQRRVQNLLADAILKGDLGRGDRAEIDAGDGTSASGGFRLQIRHGATEDPVSGGEGEKESGARYEPDTSKPTSEAKG